MKSARRGHVAPLLRRSSSISAIRAGGNAPGTEEVARAAKASAGALARSKSLSTSPLGAAPVFEMEQVPVHALLDDRRIVDGHRLQVAVIVGDGHEQVEAPPRRQQ